MLGDGRDDRDVVLRVRRVEERVEPPGPRRDLSWKTNGQIFEMTSSKLISSFVNGEQDRTSS